MKKKAAKKPAPVRLSVGEIYFLFEEKTPIICFTTEGDRTFEVLVSGVREVKKKI